MIEPFCKSEQLLLCWREKEKEGKEEMERKNKLTDIAFTCVEASVETTFLHFCSLLLIIDSIQQNLTLCCKDSQILRNTQFISC